MGVEAEIRREARRLIVRHETQARLLAEGSVRRALRTTDPQPSLRTKRPSSWELDDGFNPYLARARASRIAHSIRARLRDRTYQPRNPVRFSVEKPDATSREVCIYQVADSAVSKMLFEGILRKNLPILSARAYAYRKDVSAQDAIQYVRSEFTRHSRLFVAEYDFTKYFDTIDHDHIRRILFNHFLLTEIEKRAIEGFLRVAPSDSSSYTSLGGNPRESGIPQGTSISLFLANVAAWELDRGLEQIGVGFVRYADDTLLWSADYGRICEAVRLLHEHAEKIGVNVNLEKSPGVRLLVPPGAETEIQSTDSVDYLGYRLGLGSTTLKDAAIARVKKRIDQLTYWGLLHEPIHKKQNPCRFAGNVDRDYVSVIWRIRRYLYGDLSEKAVRRYQRREAPLRRFRGVMSAYPLIDDCEELADLDTWILDKLFLSVRKRTVLLEEQGLGSALPPPHYLPRSGLRTLETIGTTTGQTIDLSVPSVRRIAAVIRSAAAQHGPSVVGRAEVYDY
ncbi:reverse transcriptase domain-containing protein [Candidatus Poriferisocius sp.]|uniref:reverse transcriptase domain-containing protein n=1 Tax=Candidatus Poriferisocius sp. TaxID=3101276 RepID=UPI003B5958C2